MASRFFAGEATGHRKASEVRLAAADPNHQTSRVRSARDASVGLTKCRARDRGIDIAIAEVDLAEAITRPWTYQTHPTGTLGLLADRHRRVLLGAWAVAPQAGVLIHQAALAIRAGIPVDVLRDGVAQYPTFSEAYLTAAEQLDK